MAKLALIISLHNVILLGEKKTKADFLKWQKWSWIINTFIPSDSPNSFEKKRVISTQESDELTKANNSLNGEIERLEREKGKLEGAIQNHSCKQQQQHLLTSPVDMEILEMIPQDLMRRCYGN